MDKKGFFFVIVAFVLLSYILSSTYIWVRAIEMEESRYSESFRTSSMEMLVDQLNEKSVSQMANIMSNYAFYRLDNYSIAHPLKAGTADTPEEFDNIRLAMRDLILNGSASDDYFEGTGPGLEYTDEEKEDYTLYGWGIKLNDSLSASGFELEQFEINESSFVLNQTDYLLYEVNFTMSLKIKEMKSGSSTSLVRNYTVSTLVNATGMVDPYIARESIDLNLPGHKIAERQLFMAPYDFREYMGRDELGYEESYPSGYPDVSGWEAEDWEVDEVFKSLCSEESGNCYYIESGSAGQGWFYGPMVSADDADYINTILGANDAGQFILVGNYSEIIAVDDHESFGAYILTNEPGEEASECGSNMNEVDTFNPITWIDDTSGCEATLEDRTFKPFAVSEDFDMGDYIGDMERHKVLFISQYSTDDVAGDGGDPALKNYPVAFYDIEMFRDFVACAYYLPRADSPSLLQRMFDISDEDPMRTGGIFGIETTVAGQWAGGNYTPEMDPYSRVDVEFFAQPPVDGSRIMGMPGCKNVFFCTESFDSDVGQFKISQDAFARYNIEDGDGISNENLVCSEDPGGNEEHAGCDTNE